VWFEPSFLKKTLIEKNFFQKRWIPKTPPWIRPCMSLMWIRSSSSHLWVTVIAFMNDTKFHFISVNFVWVMKLFTHEMDPFGYGNFIFYVNVEYISLLRKFMDFKVKLH
jgi:hypothetical protein